MNELSGLNGQNILGNEDALNQGLVDANASDYVDLSQIQSDGAYTNPILSEAIELTPTESSLGGLGLELFNSGIETVFMASASPLASKSDNYAVFAQDQLVVRGSSDFDGDPLNPSDDAYIYAESGFDIKSNSTFPILRNDAGEPILDGDRQEQLVEGAVVVAEGYKKAEAKNNNISGLVPPQTVERQTLEIPAYEDLVTDELATRISLDTEPIIFNAKQNKIKNATDWNNLFPLGGTEANPAYVRVIGGKLDIPNNVNLSHYNIVVEKGDVKFKGSNNNLDNVLLFAESGKLEAKRLVANNVSLLASDKIDIKSESQFTGENLIANGKGDIEFKSRVVTPNETDSLRIISADDLELRSPSNLRGQLLAKDDLNVRGQSTFYGSLGAKDNINFYGGVEVYATKNEPSPSATIHSLRLTEGDEGTVAKLTVSLLNESNRVVSLDYTTADGSAVAGADYQAKTGTLAFEPGEMTSIIEVPIVGDNVYEADEAFTVELSNPNGITLQNDRATVEILNDDPQPAIVIAGVEVIEDNGTAEITLDLSNPSSQAITLDYATVDGTAVAGSDYQASFGTITIEPGVTSQTIAVELIDDSIYELSEAFTIEFSNSNGATLAEASTEVTATIIENDEPPALSVNSVVVTEGIDASADFIITLDQPAAVPVTVEYILTYSSENSAGTGITKGTITLAPGEISQTIASIPVIEDAIDELDEIYTVELSNPLNATIVTGQGTATITDNDPTPQLSVADFFINEGNDGTSTVTYTVALDNPSDREITVDYFTADGTATAGSDYQPETGTLAFAPGETSKTVTIEVTGDNLDEVNETFWLNLDNATNAVISELQGTLTIIDDDDVPVATVNEVSIIEDGEEFPKAVFTVKLDLPSGKEISLDYATSDGTAVAGSDYVATEGTITFAPGETSKTIEVEIIADSLDEIDEAFGLELTNSNNVTLATNETTATITDNDEPPTVAVDSVTLTELDEGTNSALFTVSLDNPSQRRITVGYSTSDGTAIAGEDYVASEGTIIFEPGETSKNIEVAVTGDRVFEGDEAFTVELSNPNFVIIDEERGIGTGTIANNDLPPLELEFNLANDTGASNTDNISNDATITGIIENLPGNASLNASFSGNEPSDLSDLVAPDNSFTIGIERLGQLNDGDLGDGTYTLQLAVTDSETGEVTLNELTFTFDTTNPTLNLIAPVADAEHSSTARLVGRVDEAATVEHTLDGSQIRTAELDSEYKFDSALAEAELDPGTYNTTVTVTDAAGNVTSTEVSFEVTPAEFSLVNGTNSWGAKNSEVVLLGERNGFVTETTVPIELGQTEGSRTLRFEVAPLFDTNDTNALKEDQLLVYLVDPADTSQTLLDNGEPGTAVFSLAGENADYTPGLVTFDGEAVEIDLTSLGERTEGLLVFQLLNQDSDTRSIIQAGNFSNVVDETGTEKPLFPESTIFASIGEEMDLTNLSPTDTVGVELNNVRFDSDTGKYIGELQVVNTGDEPISRQLAVVFPNLPDGVELTAASGTDEAGNPYINLDDAILSGGLDRGAISDAIEITFDNPDSVRLSLNPQVLSAGANRPPVFDSVEPISLMPGSKVEIDLQASDPDGDRVTYLIESTAELPTGTLEGDGKLRFSPSPDQIGTYEFTLVATDGIAETRQQVTIDVVADPITTTRISGVIENVEQEPLAGIPIELGELQTVTAADGSFVIETNEPLTADTLIVRGEELAGDAVYPYIAEKLPLVLGQEVYQGYNNIIDRPIYLPALDVESGQEIEPGTDNTITTENIPGASVFVEADTLNDQEGEAFTGTLSITEVPIELTPAALPEGLVPDVVVTIQPGEMNFTAPAPLSLPNLAGYDPGQEMVLWSINPNTGDFDNVGTGRVSDDGSVIETVDGGIRNSSWHFFTPPTPEPDAPEDIEENLDESCDADESCSSMTSNVKNHSGALIENHQLTSYELNGVTRSIDLTYDSLRANPQKIVYFGFSNVANVSDRYMVGGVTLNTNGFAYKNPGVDSSLSGLAGGQNIWRIPDGNTQVRASVQLDLSNVPSGVHQYSTSSGIRRWWRAANRMTGSSTIGRSNELVSVNTVNSPFGSGWSIAGWQEVVENYDNSILLINGNGEEVVFEAPQNEGSTYVSPADDFSSLERLADGTFRRTMKDGTAYTFNQNNQLASIVDRNGNETSYVYEDVDRLVKIVDPVGLETNFEYNKQGKVSKIIDPAAKQTLLDYDSAGNLIGVTDPDNSTRSWEYDSKHHIIAETDKRGNRESTFYDFSGRVIKGTRKDGTEIRVAPVQSKGLNRLDDRTAADPRANAQTIDSRKGVFSTHADGKGNVTVTKLNRAGQAIFSTDGEGKSPELNRNDRNLVETITDARGNTTEYTYDEQGNVINISQPLANTTEIDATDTVLQNVEYFTGSPPQTLTEGDLNSDGTTDLLTFNSNNTFSVFQGNADGTFDGGSNYNIPGDKDSSFLADFDGDGNTEVASLDANANLTLRSGDESADFSNSTTYNAFDLNDTEATAFSQPDFDDVATNLDFLVDTSEFDFLNLVSISDNKPFKQPDYIPIGEPQPKTLLAQLNADEIGDRVTLNDDGTFSVEIGNPDGTFEPARNYDLFLDRTELFDSALITAGDIDNDGDEDVLVAYQEPYYEVEPPAVDGYLSIFRNTGNGTLQRRSTYSGLFSEPYSYPETFVLKDVENDGLLDWIAFDGDNLEVRPIRYNLENGGLFWWTQTLDKEPEYVAVGDFVDRYLSQDVIAADASQTQLELVSYYTTSNDFDIFRIYDKDSRASVRRSSHTLNDSSEFVAVENLDNDFAFDWITVAEDRSQVNIYLKNFDGSNKAEDSITFETIPSSVNMGDLDEDGNYDLLAVYEETGDFFAYFGNGDGTFGEPVAYNLPGEYDTPILRDFDADGDEDLIAVATDEDTGEKTFSIFLDDGNGNYAEPFSYTFINDPNSFVLKDLDGDGNEDLIAVNSLSQELTVVLNQNNAGFGNEATYSLSDFDYLSFRDLDSDGDLDLLTSTENQQSFSISFNQGDGTLADTAEFNFNNSVQHLALKDLDGDGLLDLTGAYDLGQRELFVALGQEGNSYGPTTNYSLDATPDRLWLEDVDENGVLDLIATNLGRQEVNVFLTTELVTNRVVTNSTSKRTYTTAFAPERVSFSDLDSDNDLDLVVTNPGETAYSIRLSNGSGIFGSEYTTSTDLATAPAYLALTNIDGRNGLDLLAANADRTQYSLLLNNGDRTFGDVSTFDFQASLEAQAWRDLNGDGNLDLVSTNKERTAISLFLGNADGSYSEEVVYDLTSEPTYVALGDLDGNDTVDLIGIDEASSQINTILTDADGTLLSETSYTPGIESFNTLDADVDGDGDLDRVSLQGDNNSVTVELNRGDDTFEPGGDYLVGKDSVALAASDFDGDGNLDMAVANEGDRSILILQGLGNGVFADGRVNSEISNLVPNVRSSETILEDVNGNGYLDLIATNAQQDKVSVLLGREDGTFAASTSYQVGDTPNNLMVEDLNGDEIPDLVTSNSNSDTVSILPGLGNGSFDTAVDYAVGDNPGSLAVGDFNADGIKDLVVGNPNSRSVSLLLGLGDGAFDAPTSLDLNGYNPYSLGVGDFNADGVADLAVGSSSRLLIWSGLGDGSFELANNYFVGYYGINSLLVEDFNADGITDVAAGSYQRVSIFSGTTNGTFSSKKDYSSGNSSIRSLQLVELNGDKHPEITAFGFSNEFAVLRNRGDDTFTLGRSGQLGDRNTSLAAGDINGDGLADLAAVGYSSDGKTLEVTDTTTNLLGDLAYTYDPEFNQVTSFTDALGNRTLYEIDPETGNRLSMTEVVGAIGGSDDLVTNYTYTEAGLVDTMTDPEGRVMDYDYDEYGRLVREISAKGTTQETVRQYEYDAAGNQTAIIDENGNRTEFAYDELNRLTQITEADPDGDGDGTSPVSTFTYDEAGNVIETVDANQNVTKNEYDKLDRLTESTDALEQTTTYEYDDAGNLVTLTDAEGRTAQSVYDSRDRLTEIIDPLGNSTNYEYDEDDNLVAEVDPLDNRTEYQYDARSRLVRETDAEDNVTKYEYDVNDNLTATVDANEHRTEYQYDQLDRQVKQIDELDGEFTTEYDEVGNIVATTDESGRRTELAYDPLNRLTSTTDAETGVVEYEYDPVGNITSITDEEERTTNFEYDALNRQTEIIDPLDNPTSYTYDPVGNLTSVTDANEHTTSYSYDKLNRIETVTNALEDTIQTDYDAVGNIISTTDEENRTTTLAYDERDLLTTVTDAVGNTTTTTYDEVGNAIAVTDAKDNTTSYEYDKLDRLIKEIDAEGEDVNYDYDPVGNLLGFSDELDRTTTFGYDELNRRTTITNPLLHTTTQAYDKVGNLISVTDANNHTTSYSYDKINRPTIITNHLGDTVETEYDRVGNVTAITDELKRTTTFTYDPLNRQTSITDPLTQTSTTEYDAVGNVLAVTDPLSNTTNYEYDSLNRLIEEIDAENRATNYGYDSVGNLVSITDPEQNTTSYTYDLVDRLLTDTNQLEDTRSYEYDEVGNRISSNDRNGREINYQYDPLNRNTAEVWLDEAGNPVRTFNFEYDAASQLIDANDPDSAYSYEYDLDGRIASVDNAGTPGVPNVVFDYTYDPVDNLTSVTDSINGVDAGVETFTYDELDRVTEITQSGNGVADKRIDMGYDAASQMTGIGRYSDLDGTQEIASSTSTYDDAGRLTNLTHNSNGEVLSAYDWAYDKANRITQAVSPDGVSDYNYDQTDQLVDADHDYQESENYVYDNNGNRVNDGYVTGENNQLLSDGTYDYEYDAEGNRVKKTEIATGEVTEYEWDYRNKLVAVETEDSAGNVIANSEYTYDVFDRRIAKSVDADGEGAGVAEVERYVHDGDHIALTFDGFGNQIERFLHGTGIDQVLAQENAGGKVLWALADNQGSVRMVLDSEGNVVNEITYDAFGNITVESNSNVNFRFSYTGRELDEETGLYNYRTRLNDPLTGRFISEDTIGFNGGDSNLYRYVTNSPVNYTDPYGEDLYDVLNTADQFAAGFADTVTLGLSTKFREAAYGDLATRNHDGGVFNAGRVTGALTSLAVGFNTPANFAQGLSWAQKAAIAYDVAATGYGAYDATSKLLEGCATPLDALNFLPVAGYGASRLKGLKNAKNLSNLDTLDDAAEGLDNTLESLSRSNPQDIRFSQSDASPFFNKGGRVDELANNLSTGQISPNDIPPIQVVEYQGKLFSLDNRRLAAFNSAGIDDIPVERVSLDNPIVKDRFFERFDPIDGEGLQIVIATSKQRQNAQELLFQQGKIKGIQLDK